jgi:hypothetical protein
MENSNERYSCRHLNDLKYEPTNKRLAFVIASPYDGRGLQVPFEAGGEKLFVVSGIHHLHCLVSIFIVLGPGF